MKMSILVHKGNVFNAIFKNLEINEDDMPKVKVRINGNIVEFLDDVSMSPELKDGYPDKYNVFDGNGLRIGLLSKYYDRTSGKLTIALYVPSPYVNVIIIKEEKNATKNNYIGIENQK